MRQYKPSFVLIVLALLSVQQIYGQNSCIKSVTYSILTETSHALENEVAIDDLNILDILKGKDEVQYTTEMFCIDPAGFIAQTSTNRQGDNSFYPNIIAEMVITAAGLTAFDAEHNLILTTPHLTEDFDTPGFDLALTADQISNYGTSMDFNLLIDDAIADINNVGGQYWNTGNKYYFTNTFSEYIVDPTKQYTINRIYDEQNDLQMMSIATYQNSNGHLIPEYKMDYTYTQLSNGSTLQTTNSAVYLSYTLVADGQTLIDYTNPDHNIEEALSRKATTSQTTFGVFSLPARAAVALIIAPNPANDVLRIDLAKTWLGKSVEIRLLDSTTRLIQSMQKQENDKSLTIDISAVPNGVYFLKFSAVGIEHVEKLIVNHQ